MQVFRQTGLHVRLGSLSDDIKEPTPIALPDGNMLVIEPLERSANGRRLGLKDFDPCTILLNNDLAAGIPGILEDLNEQTLLPPLHAGWSLRRKSNHFAAYDEVVKKFAKLIDVDPWMLNPFFAKCGEVNFHERAEVEQLAVQVESLLAKIRKKYKEYGIKEKPFVIVKDDASTYGMGILTVTDGAQVRDLTNKRTPQSAEWGAHEVIIQEGVHTFENIHDAVAEPVVTMIDRYVIGGFYRIHADRAINENLNAPGMQFVPLAFAQHALPDVNARPGTAAPNRFYLYGVVARLAMLAASLELEKTDPHPEIY